MKLKEIRERLLESSKALTGELDAWRTQLTSMQYALSPLGAVDQQVLRQALGGVKAQLSRVLNQAMAPGSTVGFEDILRSLEQTYAKAYELGAKATGNTLYAQEGLTPADRAFVQRAAASESEYLSRFQASGFSGGSSRASQYVDAVEAQFWNGFVAGSPDDRLIYWNLGHPMTEHCPDCLSIASGSPYTRATLPTTPGAGETVCLSHCYCFLTLEEVGRPVPETGYAPAPFPPATTVETPDGTRVNPIISRTFEDLYAEINRLRQQIELAAEEERLGLARLHRELVKQVVDLQSQTNLRAVPTYSVRELTTLVQSLSSQGLSWIRNTSILYPGATIWTVYNMTLRSGVVEQILDDSHIVVQIRGQSIVVEVSPNTIVMGRVEMRVGGVQW